VIALGRSAKPWIMSSAARRSAWQEMRVRRVSTIKPERFPFSPWPMKHGFASI
jgi:hypothetical protein